MRPRVKEPPQLPENEHRRDHRPGDDRPHRLCLCRRQQPGRDPGRHARSAAGAGLAGRPRRWRVGGCDQRQRDLARRPDAEGVARLAAIWRGMRRADVFPTPALRSLMRLLSRRAHLVDPAALTRLLERHLPYRRLQDARLPCCIVATDLLDGIEVRLREGPVIQALLASAAIPAIFPSVKIGGRHVVDGGVASHTPLAAAVEMGADAAGRAAHRLCLRADRAAAQRRCRGDACAEHPDLAPGH